MSIFSKNICQYSNCHKNFFSLSDLIIHIENDHIDFDPFKIEKLEKEKPDSLPLSYVLKYSMPDDPPPRYSTSNETLYLNETVIKPEEIPTINDVVNSFNNNNYLGCDLKDKNTSLTCIKNNLRLKEEIPSQFLGIGNHKLFTLDNNHKKPFACNMPGCEKRYKNVNGIKYHYKNHHKMVSSIIKSETFAPEKFMFGNNTQNVKKSLLKCKPPTDHHKTKMEMHDLHGMSLMNFQSQHCSQLLNDTVYHNLQDINRYDECEGLQSDYLYKYNTLPTSTEYHISNNQVPLSNASFNYYNVTDMNSSDMEDFSSKNPNYFIH